MRNRMRIGESRQGIDIRTVFKVLLFFPLFHCSSGAPSLIGIRIDTSDAVVGLGSDGQILIQPNTDVVVRLFGQNLDEMRSLFVTTASNECLENTNLPSVSPGAFQFVSPISVKFVFNFPYKQQDYFFCFNVSTEDATGSESSDGAMRAVHQGKRDWQYITTAMDGQNGTTPKSESDGETASILPLPLQIVIIILLLVLSGLFSGLNLGLMSLDTRELEIILKVGDKRERAFAAKIYPVRKSGNYLLCTLLFGNVIVNSAISILFGDLTSGLVALVASSFGIVIFGEIFPQSVCSRYGLAVGAYTIFITRFFMVLTAPLSWPVSKLLDWILGEEVGTVYNKEHLLELIRVSQDRQEILKDSQEVRIVTGALELSRKRVRDAMSNIRDVYMLPSETILDPFVVSEIVKSGYTRIPVYDSRDRHNIVAVLNVKDLALLDPEDKIPLTTICKFYQRAVRFVMEDAPLDVMLEEFKKGHYHLAIVQRINTEGEGDPTYEVVGVITLEDILEEIIQAEICDEFDVVRSDRRRAKGRASVLGATTSRDVTSFFSHQEADVVALSPQLSLATYQYLTTTFDAFRSDAISEQVLQRLIKQNAVRTKPADAQEEAVYLYQKGKESDYFILILEGRARITVGEAGMVFEPGPFHYFGYEVIQMMFLCMQQPHLSSPVSPRKCVLTPDFSLKITCDMVYLKITASTYMKAFKATLVERQGTSSSFSSPAEASAANTDDSTADGRQALTPDRGSKTQPVEPHGSANGDAVSGHSTSETLLITSEKDGVTNEKL